MNLFEVLKELREAPGNYYEIKRNYYGEEYVETIFMLNDEPKSRPIGLISSVDGKERKIELSDFYLTIDYAKIKKPLRFSDLEEGKVYIQRLAEKEPSPQLYIKQDGFLKTEYRGRTENRIWEILDISQVQISRMMFIEMEELLNE
jgi:hypothetical protein